MTPVGILDDSSQQKVATLHNKAQHGWKEGKWAIVLVGARALPGRFGQP
jgi:hypothetical protein